MYRKNQYRHFIITDFNQPIGLKMNPENRWVKKQLPFHGKHIIVPVFDIEIFRVHTE